MEDVNIGQAVIIRSFEDRLDKMAEEFEAVINGQKTENDILRHEIEILERELVAREAERDFAEKQLDRIRRALA